MRLKNVLKIGLIGLLGYTSMAQETRVFDGEKNAKYLIKKYIPYDYNKDGVYDYVYGGYDLNSNGKVDAIASYKLNSYSFKNGIEVYNIQRKAFMVSYDLNEDGRADEYWFDKDMDGTLETKVVNQSKFRKV